MPTIYILVAIQLAARYIVSVRGEANDDNRHSVPMLLPMPKTR